MFRSKAFNLRALSALALLAFTAIPLLSALRVRAQTPQNASPEKTPGRITQIIFLTHATQQSDLNDIQTDLRNMLPEARIYGAASQSAISIHGTAEDIAQAQKIVAELDRPRRTYRLTYTFTEKDGSATVSTQRISLIAQSEIKTSLKQGSRVPITTGSVDSDTKTTVTQMQYIDIGLDIQATLDGPADSLRLHTRLEQSSVASDKPGTNGPNPTIRQTMLDSSASLVLDKPLALGSLDIPGSTRHQEVEVTVETVR